MSDIPKVSRNIKFDEQVNAIEKPKSDIDILKEQVTEIDKFECHNRALIEFLQMDHKGLISSFDKLRHDTCFTKAYMERIEKLENEFFEEKKLRAELWVASMKRIKSLESNSKEKIPGHWAERIEKIETLGEKFEKYACSAIEWEKKVDDRLEKLESEIKKKPSIYYNNNDYCRHMESRLLKLERCLNGKINE